MEESSEKNPEHKNMADIIDTMAVETYEMEESAFNMFDNIVQDKKENDVIESSDASSNVDEVKIEDTPFEMVDINNMVEFENEEATYEKEEALDPISDLGKIVEVTFQVAPMTHRISEPIFNTADPKENGRGTVSRADCAVSSLKKHVFYDLPLENKIAIKRLGRPTPALKIVHHFRDSSSSNHKRTYQLVIYDKNPWICGCESTNKLFCFPCLLLSKRDSSQYNTWVDSGISDLQDLGLKMNEHETSRLHLIAVSLLEEIDVKHPLMRKSKKNPVAEVVKSKKKIKILKNDLLPNETNNDMQPLTVSSLKALSFFKLAIGQKERIKKLGRPTPDLSLLISSKNGNRPNIRTFKDIYSKCTWICGCEVTNKLFCFPCLLFSNRDPIWTGTGFSDLDHLHSKIRSHQCTQLHLNSMLELNLLGKANISQQLNASYQQSVDEHVNSITLHNKLVVRNRCILSKIIDCMKMASVFLSTHQSHTGPGNFSNTEVFRDLISFSCELDVSFKRDIEESSFLFKGLSEEFQNYLLSCMLLVCQENIKREISMSNYVSVIVEETTSITSPSMLAIIFRYVLANGKPAERFWTFVKPLSQNVDHVGKFLCDFIQKIVPNRSKLVSQSYDGGCSIISGNYNEIQAIIQEHYTYAYYVHCYAHDLNLVIAQSASQNQQVRMFFSNLNDVIDFWCRTPQFSSALAQIFANRKYAPQEVSYLSNISNIKTRPVDTLYRYGRDLIACIEDIEATSKHSPTISKAGHIRRVLNDQEFIFWIKVFYSITPHVENLMIAIQHECTDTKKIKTKIGNFLEIVNIDDEEGVTEKKFLEKKRSGNENNITKEEKEVRQIACKELVKRYSFLTPLSIISLFDSNQFIEYRKVFPSELIEEIIRFFPFFDVNRLRAELQLIYNHQDFIELKGVVSLMVFLTKNGLPSTFPETYKLLTLVLTIPMETNEEERRFDTHKRIGHFFQPCLSYNDSNITALAMLSVERSMIRNIPNFNEQVIELFSTPTEWTTNFSFKVCN